MTDNLMVSEYITEHLNEAMDNALQAERHPLWKRACPEFADLEFTYLGLLRSISAVDSGHHFIQTLDEVYDNQLPLSTYFKALKSPRRAEMIKALEVQSYQLHCQELASQGIDYLQSFSDLEGYNVVAADGHFIDHACHTEKGANGKAYAAGFIYSMNLRNGLVHPYCCITNGTIRHHEIPALRHYIEEQNSMEKNIYIYDKAVIDYAWWAKQAMNNQHMISVLKENAVTTFIEDIPFDKESELNTGIESYALYEIKGLTLSVIDYRDPENNEKYHFITTLPTSFNPGVIAILYYKRWTIEKAFNNKKSNLKETKAWSSDMNSLKNQMRFTAMSYNLMRVFEETSKSKQAPVFIHPSDKKYIKALNNRNEIAQKEGNFVNPLLFKERIVRICSYTIRAIQNAILMGKSMMTLMKGLADQLIMRFD